MRQKEKLDKKLESLRAAAAANQQVLTRVDTEKALRGAKQEVQKAEAKTRGLEGRLDAERAFLEASVDWDPVASAGERGSGWTEECELGSENRFV